MKKEVGVMDMLRISPKVRLLMIRAGLFALTVVIVVVVFIAGKMAIERLTGTDLTMDTTVIVVAVVVGLERMLWKLVRQRALNKKN